MAESAAFINENEEQENKNSNHPVYGADDESFERRLITYEDQLHDFSTSSGKVYLF